MYMFEMYTEHIILYAIHQALSMNIKITMKVEVTLHALPNVCAVHRLSLLRMNAHP